MIVISRPHHTSGSDGSLDEWVVVLVLEFVQLIGDLVPQSQEFVVNLSDVNEVGVHSLADGLVDERKVIDDQELFDIPNEFQ